jgi:hypothetical protein
VQWVAVTTFPRTQLPGHALCAGVAHETVDNDYEGVVACLRWLAFVPRARGAPLPIMDVGPGDAADRDVAFEPPATAYDPRLLLTGYAEAAPATTATLPPPPLPGAGASSASLGGGGGGSGSTPKLAGLAAAGGGSSPQVAAAAAAGASAPPPVAAAGAPQPQPPPPLPAHPAPAPPPPTRWVSGFCDRGSWAETMAGWAKSVVTGRARLGGIPIGVIIPELRTSTAVVPADPAAPDSKEAVLTQAGQVWFPDSAFKTAQALRDFAGEGLPVVIFANWRGFSGGQRDM